MSYIIRTLSNLTCSDQFDRVTKKKNYVETITAFIQLITVYPLPTIFLKIITRISSYHYKMAFILPNQFYSLVCLLNIIISF